MKKYRVAMIVGSLRRESLNRKLSIALSRLAPANVEMTELQIGDFPLYNQDDDNSPAVAVMRLKSEITASHGVIFLTPEYNRSIPGVLKNALDHASRPYGKSVWAGKPAGVLGVSVGAIGTATAQQHLRNVLAYLDMPTLGQPEVYLQANDKLFDASGAFGEGSLKFMQAWLDAYVKWLEKYAG